MRRSIETIDLDHGSWLRLDCGHPVNESASAVNDDEPADCALCDRAQLPVGLIAVGPVRRRHIGDPRPCTVMTATAWTVLTVESGAVRVGGRGHSDRPLAAHARAVLVAGAPYQLTALPDAVIELQRLEFPRAPVASTDVGARTGE